MDKTRYRGFQSRFGTGLLGVGTLEHNAQRDGTGDTIEGHAATSWRYPRLLLRSHQGKKPDEVESKIHSRGHVQRCLELPEAEPKWLFPPTVVKKKICFLLGAE